MLAAQVMGPPISSAFDGSMWERQWDPTLETFPNLVLLPARSHV